MAKTIDLTRPKVQDRQRQVGTYGTQTPLASASVERGTTRWLDGSVVTIEGAFGGSGSFDWTGPFTQAGATRFTGSIDSEGPFRQVGPTVFTGDVDSAGTWTQTGPTNLDGPTVVSDDFEIIDGGLFKAGESEIRPDGSAKFGLFDVAANGDLDSKGKLSIGGETTLKKDLSVVDGAKIKVGTMELVSIPGGSGQLNFPSSSVSGSVNGISIYHATRVNITAARTSVSGVLTIDGMLPAATGRTANVYYDQADGQLKYIA